MNYFASFKVKEFACFIARICDSFLCTVALLETLSNLSLDIVADKKIFRVQHEIIATTATTALRPLFRANQKINKKHENKNKNKNSSSNNNGSELTNWTVVTLQLPFSPSAIKRPPASDNLLSLCKPYSYNGWYTAAFAHTRNTHPCTTSRPPSHAPCTSHAPAYQIDCLQDLKSAQLCAQRLNIVVGQLCTVQSKYHGVHVHGNVTLQHEVHTLALERSISSQVSNSKNPKQRPIVNTMPLSDPRFSWRTLVISWKTDAQIPSFFS